MVPAVFAGAVAGGGRLQNELLRAPAQAFTDHLTRRLTRRCADRRAQCVAVAQQLDLCKRVAGTLENQAVAAVRQVVDVTAGPGAHHGQPARHRLEDHPAERLQPCVGGAIDKTIQRIQECRGTFRSGRQQLHIRHARQRLGKAGAAHDANTASALREMTIQRRIFAMMLAGVIAAQAADRKNALARFVRAAHAKKRRQFDRTLQHRQRLPQFAIQRMRGGDYFRRDAAAANAPQVFGEPVRLVGVVNHHYALGQPEPNPVADAKVDADKYHRAAERH